MNRRNFFSRLGKCMAAAALVTHLELGRLCPILPLLSIPKEEPISLSWQAFHAAIADYQARKGCLPRAFFVTPEEYDALANSLSTSKVFHSPYSPSTPMTMSAAGVKIIAFPAMRKDAGPYAFPTEIWQFWFLDDRSFQERFHEREIQSFFWLPAYYSSV